MNPAQLPMLVLVEGASDRVAVETLAERRGLDLAAAHVRVVELGGATGIARALDTAGHGQLLAGLVDAGEERFFQHALEDFGLGENLGRAELESLGFFVCVADLEDELIRALGVDRVLAVVAAAGEHDSFRVLQQQPYQRGRRVEDQLHRFLGTASGRKARYGRLLVEALDPEAAPAPLVSVLEDAVVRRSRS